MSATSFSVWHKISVIGIPAKATGDTSIRGMMLANQFSFALFLLIGVILVLFASLYPENIVILRWMSGLLAALLLGLFLNSRSFFSFSQFLLSSGLGLLLLCMTIHSKVHQPWMIHEGSYYNPRYFMIGLTFIPFIVFEIRQWKLLLVSVSLNLTLLFAYNTIHNIFVASPEAIGLGNVDLSFASVASSAAAVAIALGMVFLRRANYRYEKQIEHLLEKTRNQNEELNSSIRYARRLQEAVLSPIAPEETNGALEVLLSPRDELSGDFFFYYTNGGQPFISVIDCTGHGVPGAFVSLMANKSLQQAVRKSYDGSPAEILLDVQRRFSREFTQPGSVQVRDGMDLLLCRIIPDKKTLKIAGARGIGFLITRNGLITLNSDRRSIGDGSYEPFNEWEYPYESGDLLVLTSDGFPDQFGGPQEKKYGKKRLRVLLESLYGAAPTLAREQLKQQFSSWKGSAEQTDDVCIAVYLLS